MFLPTNITLKPGDSGEFVTELQRRLSLINFYPAIISGIYDGMTTSGVMSFQSAFQLSTDGIAGPETLRKLNAVLTGDTGSSEDEEASDAESEKEEKERAEERQRLSMHILQDTAQMTDPSILGHTETARIEDPAKAAAPLDDKAQTNLRTLLAQDQVQQQAQQLPTTPLPLSTHEADAKSAQADLQMLRQQNQIVEMLAQPLKSAPLPEAGSRANPELSAQLNADAAKATGQKPLAEKPTPDGLAKETGKNAIEGKPQGDPAMAVANTADAKPPMAEKPARSPLLQKMMDYIEAHLPKEAIREVIGLGMSMMRAGVRENPLAADAPVRAPEPVPGRGPEQQVQRGGNV